MKQITDFTHEEARKYFLEKSSYFSTDLPDYISFKAILDSVSLIMDGNDYKKFQSKQKPDFYSNTNYKMLTNKDGKFAWRPLELIHPVIYVSLVNTLCNENNWKTITNRLMDFTGDKVECCSIPVTSYDGLKDSGETIKNWWQQVEQKSLCYSLEFSHLLHTDVTDCYGSLYTHAISWAIHGVETSKQRKNDDGLLGNKIDRHIRAGRYGQTNGIPQGSELMNLIAEIVLGYVDLRINVELKTAKDVRILRYRDDYRIFANSDDAVEDALKVISKNLWEVGMRLGVSKTQLNRNIVEGAIKPDKLAGLDLQDLGFEHAKTIQKQLLRLHAFGQRFPNSGAIKRLLSEFHENIVSKLEEKPADLEELIAIATDIGFISPATFPAVAGILSKLIAFAPAGEKELLWTKVRSKILRVPHNGYLEIWLQRVAHPNLLGQSFNSEENICKIVSGASSDLWENGWIEDSDLLEALDTSSIIVMEPSEMSEVLMPEEIELFRQNAWAY